MAGGDCRIGRSKGRSWSSRGEARVENLRWRMFVSACRHRHENWVGCPVCRTRWRECKCKKYSGRGGGHGHDVRGCWWMMAMMFYC
ncbi:putative formin-like protein 6 isoform X2 [Iris pallida]|uniref:Formin-like protein 6 isoform X2 n=1 Tax=Iris pallida TaxID=29817 RepID=A0AAX6GAZ6_IRIPA|nr:putative formin-like protein 6 isoform X2 [Iris pallida]